MIPQWLKFYYRVAYVMGAAIFLVVALVELKDWLLR